MKTYVYPQKEEISIIIYSCTTQKWLSQLGYEYQNICKDIFIDGYKQSNVIEDCKNFLKKMEKFKPYIVKFEENGAIKEKIYPFHCIVHGHNCCLIIIITYDECIFSANNDI